MSYNHNINCKDCGPKSPYKQCKKCVMDDTDPDITFDMEGVCNYCREYVQKEKQRKVEKTNLPWIIYEIKKQGKCLLGLSGGADSSTCLHLLLEQGIKPITFSLDNGWEDKNANENVRKLVEKTGVKHEVVKLDNQKFRELQNAYMKSGVPNIEVPTDHILMALTYQMARKYGCKYVISGGNLATESTMPRAWSFPAKDLTNMRDIYKKMTGKRLKGLPTISLHQYIWNRFVKGIKIINLLDYYEYDREIAIGLLQKEYGWQDYGDKHEENPFTKWFQNYFLVEKCGIDKRKAHYSSLIYSGQMTRDEALLKLAVKGEYEPLEFELGEPKSHYDFKTSAFWWKVLSKIYKLCK